jgi:hypothetical protein
MRTLPVVLALVVVAAGSADAQVLSRPTDPPLVTAANESWFLLQEPIQFAGDLYYPAGAQVFFNGNTMVRTGHYNGVPIYSDTTVEPFSILLVPVTRGLMQPYERLRQGALAGTTGSRAPSFPVQRTPDVTTLPMAPGAPTGLPLTVGAISVFTPEPLVPVPVVPTAAGPQPLPGVFTTGGAVSPLDARGVISLRAPENNDGIWIMFRNQKWLSAGPAVPLSDAFTRIGDHAGFPVYERRGLDERRIYVDNGAGQIAPYRLKE